MNCKLQIILITFLSFTYSSIIAQNSNWKLQSESDDMKIYTRFSDSSPIKELKIELNVECTLSQIISLLNDYEHYQDWIYKLIETKIISKGKTGNITYYLAMDLPWPMMDRDMVQISKMTQNPNTLEIKITTETDSTFNLIKEQDKRYRLTNGRIVWSIKPISPTKTHINYYLVSDPGGNVPPWLINMFIEVGPRKTMTNFREELKKNKYKNEVKYIKNFTG